MLRLDTPPSGVPPERWLNPDSPARPQLGELWLTSWDGAALSMGVVTRVAPTFVLCWPVTLQNSPVFAPALLIDRSPLGVPLLVWPTRETGLGMHMLHRRFGQLMSPTTMNLVESALGDEAKGELPLPLADHTVEGDEAERASDEMLDTWESICLNVWPKAVLGESVFNESTLKAIGIPASDIADVLGVSLPTAVSLIRGEHVPTAEQVEALAMMLDADPRSLLDSGEGEVVRTLLNPQFKDGLLRLVENRRISEASARDLVRSEVALAARSDGDAASRVWSIIDRLQHSE